VHALPVLTPGQVARDIAEAAVSGVPHLVRPRRVAGAHLVRELPSRLNDALLIGIP
jgi:hypothetical protein